ncbi:unnamed protein product [Sympodiomycopsis kandeliae]
MSSKAEKVKALFAKNSRLKAMASNMIGIRDEVVTTVHTRSYSAKHTKVRERMKEFVRHFTNLYLEMSKPKLPNGSLVTSHMLLQKPPAFDISNDRGFWKLFTQFLSPKQQQFILPSNPQRDKASKRKALAVSSESSGSDGEGHVE